MSATTFPSSIRALAAALAVALVASLIALSPASASPASSDVLADFEGGTPVDFFDYGGPASTVSPTTLVVGNADGLAKPGQLGDDEILSVDFNVTDWGGFGQDVPGAPADWSNYTSFDFWFHGSGSGATYQAEISDNRSDPDADTAERFDVEFTDDVAGWRFISIPFEDFTRAIDFQPGGAPDDGFTLTEVWGWGIVLPGIEDTVHLDDVGLGLRVIDNFEDGVPVGVDADLIEIGFSTFNGANSTVDLLETVASPPAPALPVPTDSENNVLQVDITSTTFAGFIHRFEDETQTAWVPQNWSTYGGFAVWFHGTGDGGTIFIDLLENRNPGSTTDDAERWTVEFNDDVAGWRLLQFPFSDFTWKGVGNGAPDDGLLLLEVHGWAFGTLSTTGKETYYFDDAHLYGAGELAPLAASFAGGTTNITEGTTGDVTVRLNRPFSDDDPGQVSVSYTTEPGTAEPGRDYTPTSGELVFTPGTTELSFPIETFGDDKFLGNKRIVLRLSDPVDVELNSGFQSSAIIVDDDPYDARLVDDFEHGAYMFDGDGLAPAVTELSAGDSMAVPGQGAYEHVLEVTTPVLGEDVPIVVETTIPARGFCGPARRIVPVSILTTDRFDATTIDHKSVTVGGGTEAHVKGRGGVQRHIDDVDGDGDLDLLVHVRVGDTGYDCSTEEAYVSGTTFSGQIVANAPDGVPALRRDFTLPQDWSRDEAISFWFHGTGDGDRVGVTLKDNAALDSGPAGWELAWSDEFEGIAGTAPSPENWTHEIGDVTPDGKNGWGNSELQYYTDSTDNSALDGEGNLAITLRENEDPELQCYYGTCEYTSARLLSWHKSEFAYGRVETSLKLPTVVTDANDLQGLWPAFWSLGTDIDRTPWPAAGEIDIMEWVGRLPDEIFGTIHGPGYSGGDSFGGFEPLTELDRFHEFAIEWEPDEIRWYLDDVLYHTATPADVAPNEWVFDKPFFLLLNFAIGGNFGGPVGDGVAFPQDYLVDYVRIYEAPDTSERFEASFTDDEAGWQQVTIPFADFSRSEDQPNGAPDDGLTLDEVNGYGFSLLDGGTSDGALRIDQVRRVAAPAPAEIEVTTLEDGAKGSLRDAIDYVADGGTVTIAPDLAAATVVLEQGPIVIDDKTVTIEGSGITVDGAARDRVLLLEPGADVTLTDATLRNGFGWQLGGCVLNNGSLLLDGVTVTDCVMATDAGDFWQGGGGIYSGDGALLHLRGSVVEGNLAGWSGGGVYSFLNTTTIIENSTIAGNVSNDVGGGLRILGNATIEDSEIVGNEATSWFGGAAFLTDGETSMVNTLVQGNVAPPWAPAALFVGTFGTSAATLNLSSMTIVDNVSEACVAFFGGAGAVSINSDGTNVFQDGTCGPVAGDIVDGVVVEPSP